MDSQKSIACICDQKCFGAHETFRRCRIRIKTLASGEFSLRKMHSIWGLSELPLLRNRGPSKSIVQSLLEAPVEQNLGYTSAANSGGIPAFTHMSFSAFLLPFNECSNILTSVQQQFAIGKSYFMSFEYEVAWS